MSSILTQYRRCFFLWPFVGALAVLAFAVTVHELGYCIHPWEVSPFITWPLWCMYRTISFRCPSCGRRLWMRRNVYVIFGMPIWNRCSLISESELRMVRIRFEWRQVKHVDAVIGNPLGFARGFTMQPRNACASARETTTALFALAGPAWND